MKNPNSLDGVCAALAYAMGIEPPAQAAPASEKLTQYIDRAFGGAKADRVVMYNPDAISQWVYRKHPFFTAQLDEHTDMELPLCSVLPSFTPVCFGTMYTGAQPAVHGIQGYVKPVIKIDTLFDALIRAGKKPAIVSYDQCSLGIIYRERPMDYFICRDWDEATAVGVELILKDEHDFIVIYNGNYDAEAHNYGPESVEALSELRSNVHNFGMISDLIRRNWKHHNTLLSFAMDHGNHLIDEANGFPRYDEKDIVGAHGFDLEEDLNIVHRYKAYRKTK